MKNFLIIVFIMFLGFAPAFAEWVNVQDIKEPIKLLDTDNIYKLNYQGADGAVFRLRYIGKDKKEQVASIFADFKNNKAGIISIKPYRENTIPNFAIVDELKMKDITKFKTNFKKIKAFAGEDYIKACPETYLIPPYTQEEKAAIRNYIKKMDSKIKKNWHMPKDQKEAYAVVYLKINKDGNIETCDITQSSHDEMFDQTVLQAANLSEPFGAFPKQYDKDFMWINYVFGYNAVSARDEQNNTLYKINTAANVLTTLLLIPLMILGID